MFRRNIHQAILDALNDTPVVMVHGARQVGKTTLVQSIGESRGAAFVTLDDAGALSAARADAQGFVAGLGSSVVIDEVQRAPELFPAIKLAVDRDRSPGRFLLTGSASVLLVPRLPESLVGRMQIITLWPLAQAEIEGNSASFVDSMFFEDGPAPGRVASDRSDVLQRVRAGGYPEPLTRGPERQRAWFGSCLTTILQRDVRDLAQIEGLTALPRLLSSLAARSASLLNVSDISRDSGIPNTTLQRYLTLLEATFLIRRLPAWATNRGQQLVKSPKTLLNDSGLICSLLGIDTAALLAEDRMLGPVIENFVAMEIVKDAGWSRSQPGLYHSRTRRGGEVDLVLEEGGGRIAGIEVKSSATVKPADFKGLRELQQMAGDRFRRGLVVYLGDTVIPFGERLFAVPVQKLWTV